MKEYSFRKIGAKDFSKIRIVGKGAFGAVYAVEKLDTHKIYAWKEMDKRKLKFDKSFDVALNELKRLTEISSPFVCGLKYSLTTENCVILVMDFYSGGDLKYHMKYSSPDRRKKPFSPDVAKFYAAEILLGLEEMHKHGIIFRDLKPANVLLDDRGHIHISDLGWPRNCPRIVLSPLGCPVHLDTGRQKCCAELHIQCGQIGGHLELYFMNFSVESVHLASVRKEPSNGAHSQIEKTQRKLHCLKMEFTLKSFTSQRNISLLRQKTSSESC
jgi:serine/threonine protein kinase